MPLLGNLTRRDLKVKYRRSFLGLAWSILNPLLTMLVLTQVFGLLLKIRVENFPVYYIVGAAMWNFFTEATTGAMSSIIGSAALIKKVYIPQYIFPLEKCLYALVNLAFSMIAVIIVMLFQLFPITWAAVLLFIPVLYCFIFSVGMSLILSSLTVYFRDILHLYGVLTTIWMYLTPIIYPISIIRDSVETSGAAAFVYGVIQWNPMYHYVEYFRSVLMYGTGQYTVLPGLIENLICAGFAVFTLAIGALIFKKAQRKFILHI
ncbi:MAG: ABC transporter permease [Clostridia bacterium]|nr:ABC transporter permease [Clostridia bacterium]